MGGIAPNSVTMSVTSSDGIASYVTLRSPAQHGNRRYRLWGISPMIYGAHIEDKVFLMHANIRVSNMRDWYHQFLQLCWLPCIA